MANYMQLYVYKLAHGVGGINEADIWATYAADEILEFVVVSFMSGSREFS